MSDRDRYDGLCGIPSPFTARDGLHFRCKFEMGHGGDHDWKKYEDRFAVWGGTEARLQPVPVGCTCTPVRQTTGEGSEYGRVVDWIFDPTCVIHACRA